MLLLIDNYDSFTYNLYQYLAELGAEPLVRRNDEITVAEAEALRPTHLVLSPGPCTPREAGICVALIQSWGRASRPWASAWDISVSAWPSAAWSFARRSRFTAR